MKQSNLISLLSAFTDLDSDAFRSYLSYYSIEIKDNELKDLKVFVEEMQFLSGNICLFDKYFIGYSIPQISKEFDLLRIDRNSIVNIELKKNSSEVKITTQLLKNRYYLSFLKRNTYCFTYVADHRKLYSLDMTGTLRVVSLRQLLVVLFAQKVEKISDIDSFFKPSNYLVSPFNSTVDFVEGRFFLTTHQEEIKKEIFCQLSKPTYSILSIKGNAGTGKTLLTYDIAKDVLNKKNTLVVHCGYLNGGQNLLNESYGWEIIPAKDIMEHDLSRYYLIIVDEAQRIYPKQLNYLIGKVKELSINLIFSYDGQQTLRKGEINNNVADKIENELTIDHPFELTNKIRTNKEVASFIQCLFSKRRGVGEYKYDNIELNYFDDYKEAKAFLEQLRLENWKVINYTPSSYATFPYEQHNLDDEFDNAHTVIGQEFDNVVAVIDKHFYYKNGSLSTRRYNSSPYYHPTKMLFQIVSRTRLRLGVVIISNVEILDRCLEILNHK